MKIPNEDFLILDLTLRKTCCEVFFLIFSLKLKEIIQHTTNYFLRLNASKDNSKKFLESSSIRLYRANEISTSSSIFKFIDPMEKFKA